MTCAVVGKAPHIKETQTAEIQNRSGLTNGLWRRYCASLLSCDLTQIFRTSSALIAVCKMCSSNDFLDSFVA